MNPRSISLVTGMVIFAVSVGALAQSPSTTMVGYGGLPTRAGKGGETGLQAGDGLVHVGAGAEAGYDSNVYYSSATNGTVGAGILRVTSFLEYTNATRTGEVPSGLFFDLGAALLYREYLSDQVDSKNRRAFMPSVGGSLEFSGNQALALTLSDSFARTEDPPYISGTPLIRNANSAFVQLRITPGGGRLQGVVRYLNGLDLFDSSTNYTFADSMSHEAMLDLSWKWLPKTALFVDIRQGFVSYLHSNSGKVSSFPLHATIGIRGLITEKTSIGLSLGYSNGFYSGVSTVGFAGSTYVAADINYHPLIATILTLGYRHDFQNSIISNFYYLDGVYAGLQQQVLGRIAMALSGRWEHRNMQGLIGVPAGGQSSRVDDFFQAGATIDVTLRGGMYIGAGYSLLANKSDQPIVAMQPSPEYLKHQVFGRLGFTY